MKKRVVLLSLALTSSILLSSCSGGSGAKDGPVKTAEPAAVQKTDAAQGEKKLSALVVPFTSIQDISKNKFTLWMEKKTGVKIDWSVVEGKDASDKVNLMLSSGEKLPDMIIGANLKRDAQFLYGSQGLLLPMNDLIEKHGTEIKKVFAYSPVFKMTSIRPDGKIYTLTSFEECFHCTVSQKMYINTAWLKKLGLNMPTTTDEFYNVLKAFKEKDPNGNGKADEIPLSGFINWWHSNIDGFLMCPFIYNDGADRLNVVNGKIVPAFTQEEWREGLKFLNKLYKDGLMDKQAVIQDSAAVKQLVEGQEIRLGAVAAGHLGGFTNTNGEATKNYDAVPPLKGPKGVQLTGYYPTQAKETDTVAITKYCKDPDTAMKWIDVLFGEEASLANWFGEKGVEWDTAKDGEKGLDGKPAIFNTMGKAPVYTQAQQNSAFVHTSPYSMPARLFNGVATPQDNPFDLEKRLYNQSLEYVKYIPKEVLPGLSYTVEDAKKVATIKTAVNTYVNESIARFITGGLDPEKDWNKYLDEFKKMDLDTYVGIVQKSYDKLAAAK